MTYPITSRPKPAEIASYLPDATLEVDELRNSERIYDPFLAVSYGEESYYVEVWGEPEFEQKYT